MKIVVIGAGPGGYETAIMASQLGAEVTIIEKEATLGGTCLNVGCIPTKALIHSAEMYSEAVNEAKSNGVIIDNVSYDFAGIMKKKAAVVQRLTGGVAMLMKAYNITVVSGTAKFASKDKIVVTAADGSTTDVAFDKAIIATGSIPTVVPLPGHDLPGVVDSTGALAFEEVPKSLAIIGGGVIGTEIGYVYNTLGTKITVIEMLPDILANLDGEIANVLKNSMKQKKIDVMTSTKVNSIEQAGSELKINITDPEGKDGEVIAEKVLMCVGRRPATAELDLDAAGIENDRGRIIVDGDFKTNVDNIYAIGDCIGGIMLAHVASAEGIACVEKIMGHTPTTNLSVVPSCVYTNPELSGVGLTEEACKKEGLDYEVGRFPLMANGRSIIVDGTNGVVKVIADKKTKKLLGVHMAGPYATELISEAALALAKGLTVDDILDTIHPHPSVSESVLEAAHAVFGNAINMPPMKK